MNWLNEEDRRVIEAFRAALVEKNKEVDAFRRALAENRREIDRLRATCRCCCCPHPSEAGHVAP